MRGRRRIADHLAWRLAAGWCALPFLGLLALAASCSAGDGPLPRGDAGTGSDSLTGPGPDGPLCGAPLPRPWWLDDPPAACSDHIVHQPPQAYDDCGDLLSRAAAHDPATCKYPVSGLWLCDSAGGDIWLTQGCFRSTHCPEGMACSRGLCVQRCDPGGPNTCVRCQQACDQSGLCRYKSPYDAPCTTDCDCAKGIRCNLISGRCAGEDQNPQLLQCGPGTSCPCGGGTCNDTGKCCLKSDGTIAALNEPECTTAAP
jgi:hypothetical protein